MTSEQSVGVKFYSLLERRGPMRAGTQADSDLRLLKEAIASSDVQNATIYKLKNNRGFFVKAVASSFDAIREAFDPVFRFCLDQGFRAQTFPIPNVAISAEADLIDAVTRDQSWQTELNLNLLDSFAPNARPLLAALSTENRKVFLEFLEMNRDVLGRDVIQRDIAGLLEGVAIGDPRQVTRSLNFVFQIEDLWRQVVFLLLQEVAETGWPALLQRLVVEKGLPPVDDTSDSDVDTPFDSWSLQDTVTATGIIASENETFNARVRGVLSNNWRKDLVLVRDLRNELAHGRFRPAIDSDGLELRRYLSAARVFSQLDLFVSNAHNISPKGNVQ